MDQSNRMNATNCPVVIAMTSGKGGIGKSTVAINLAIALANTEKKVILFDTNLNTSCIDSMLGVNPEKSILDVVDGNCFISQILTQSANGIKVICSYFESEEPRLLTSTQYYNIIKSFSDISDDVDYLIIDTAPGLDGSAINFLAAAHEIVIVINDEKSSISGAYTLMKFLNKNYGKYRFKIIANGLSKAVGKEIYLRLNKIADDYLDVAIEYIGSISFDISFKKNNSFISPRKSTLSKKSSREYSEIANKINMLPLRTTPRGNVEFFTESFIFSKAGKNTED